MSIWISDKTRSLQDLAAEAGKERDAMFAKLAGQESPLLRVLDSTSLLLNTKLIDTPSSSPLQAFAAVEDTGRNIFLNYTKDRSGNIITQANVLGYINPAINEMTTKTHVFVYSTFLAIIDDNFFTREDFLEAFDSYMMKVKQLSIVDQQKEILLFAAFKIGLLTRVEYETSSKSQSLSHKS